MAQKPQLIVFNNYIISGIGSFFKNLLSHDPFDQFEKKIIHLSNDAWPDVKMSGLFDIGDEEIVGISSKDQETVYEIARRVQQRIPAGEGAVISSFSTELYTLHLYPRRQKTVYFLCHDDNHLKTALKFQFVIDVFLAHNPVYADMMKEQMPARAADVYYIPYGIKLPDRQRIPAPAARLRVVWLARLMEHKGIRRIPDIDDLLSRQGVHVEWTIIGDGPEKEMLLSRTNGRTNFRFETPADFNGVADLLTQQDVYILPSRLDGLPVALIESMSVGCVPVISEFNQGMKKIVTTEMGYVLPVGDDHAFANTIALLDKDRELLEQMSKEARKRTRDNYDIDLQARKYFELFGAYRQLKRKLPSRLPLYKGLFVTWFVPRSWRQSLRKMLNK